MKLVKCSFFFGIVGGLVEWIAKWSRNDLCIKISFNLVYVNLEKCICN